MSTRVRKRPVKFIEEEEDSQQVKGDTPRVRQAKKKPKPATPSGDVKEVRKCDRSGCSADVPICFANASEKCCGSGMTSRWYHLSPGEHFCNDCFDYFYRSHRDGYPELSKWKKEWSSVGRTEASIKTFMNDRYLPYWIQCNRPDCGKWRQLSKDLELTEEFVRTFQCGMVSNSKTQSVNKDRTGYCDAPEDERAQKALEPFWINTLVQPPLLRSSPAAPYLTQYFPDGVGMSATSAMPTAKNAEVKLGANFQPFVQPDEYTKAMCLRPDMMEADELEQFPEFSREQQMYIGLRNIIVTLWNSSHQDWLTVEKCAPFVLCRGLVRIRCIMEVDRIIMFLTRKGLVNTGLIREIPTTGILPPEFNRDHVVIIGAGPAGLAAARQLKNFGTKVTVLEARGRVGGRIEDDWSLGACVGRGAQLVNGCINNPITLLCDQAGLELRPLNSKCVLMTDDGSVVSSETDKRIDFHFNALLDIIADWRKDQDISKDCSLLDKIHDMHKQFVEESHIEFSEEEMHLIDFHISNLEFALGSDLSRVSALSWDHNETYAQFGGDHGILPEGYLAVLTRLAEGINIQLNSEVCEVNYEDSCNIKVRTCSGEEYTGSRVLVTVPLPVLKKEKIKFVPELSERKTKAIQSLGVGFAEKIAVKFPQRFWNSKVGDAGCFGHVTGDSDVRGLCSVFYDVSPPGFDIGILTTYLSGKAVELRKKKSDEEMMELLMSNLQKLFPDVDVPSPTGFFITSWENDVHSGIAYSFMPIGCQPDAYSVIAEDIMSRIYFAGEATNERYPQSVTGAYLSGIREAGRIVLASFTNS